MTTEEVAEVIIALRAFGLSDVVPVPSFEHLGIHAFRGTRIGEDGWDQTVDVAIGDDGTEASDRFECILSIDGKDVSVKTARTFKEAIVAAAKGWL